MRLFFNSILPHKCDSLDEILLIDNVGRQAVCFPTISQASDYLPIYDRATQADSTYEFTVDWMFESWNVPRFQLVLALGDDCALFTIHYKHVVSEQLHEAIQVSFVVCGGLWTVNIHNRLSIDKFMDKLTHSNLIACWLPPGQRQSVCSWRTSFLILGFVFYA